VSLPRPPASLHPKQHHTAAIKDMNYPSHEKTLLFSRRWVGFAAWPPANKPAPGSVSAGVPWLLAGTCCGHKQAYMLLAARWQHCGEVLRHRWLDLVVSVVRAESLQHASCPHFLAPAHTVVIRCGESFPGTTGRGES